jgi:hypothetical protein
MRGQEEIKIREMLAYNSSFVCLSSNLEDKNNKGLE